MTILRLKQVMARTGLGRSTIYQMIEAGTFPQQYKLGARAVGWSEEDIDKWIDALSKDKPPVKRYWAVPGVELS